MKPFDEIFQNVSAFFHIAK